MKEDHEKLLQATARLQAVQRQIDDARRQLHERAEEQKTSLEPVKQHVEAHVARGKGGGILAGRALHKLVVEQARLNHIVLTRDDDPG